ncbi:MAG: hypothetical protein ACOVP8_07445, partial [Phycisphaerales bacterium]
MTMLKTISLLVMLAGATTARAQDAVTDISAQDEFASGQNMDRDLLPTPVKRTDDKSDDKAADAAAPEADEESRLHFSAGVDFANAYYY